MYFNAQSVLSKIAEIEIILHQEKPDVVAVAESRTTEDVMTTELKIIGYRILRLDFSSRFTGGVLFYVRNGLKFAFQQKMVVEKELWILTINVADVNVSTLYRSPNTSKANFLQIFEEWYANGV
jgi:exonuclease III